MSLSVPYCDLLIERPVRVQLIIRQKGRSSEPFRFLYVPSTQICSPTHHLKCYLEYPLHSRPISMLLNSMLSAREVSGHDPNRAYSEDAANRFTPSETICGRNDLEPALEPAFSSVPIRRTSQDSSGACSTPNRRPRGVIRYYFDRDAAETANQ